MDPDQDLQKQAIASKLDQSRPEARKPTLGWSQPEATNSTGVGLNQLPTQSGHEKASSTGATADSVQGYLQKQVIF